MRFDYHAHTPLCHHAEGPEEAYIERAIELGMQEFGFSEHSPWMIHNPGERPSMMDWEDLPRYLRKVEALAERFNQDGGQPFRLRLGLEADFVPSRLDVAREVIEHYPWDYVLGSVHHLGFWCVPKSSETDHYDRHRIEDIFELYFEQVRQMIDARLCDIIAHIDLPKRHDFWPEGGVLRYLEPLIPNIRAAGMSVEINTSGMDYPCAEPFPGWESIEALHAGGVPLLVSSDSHKPDHVGRHFDTVFERLRAIGVNQLVRYERREKILTPLPAFSANR